VTALAGLGVFCGVGTKILLSANRDNYPKWRLIVSIFESSMNATESRMMCAPKELISSHPSHFDEGRKRSIPLLYSIALFDCSIRLLHPI
jgi:hypothetical protein